MTDENKPIRKERTRSGRVEAAGKCDDMAESALDEAPGKADLDERERRQSTRRKPPGPGGPARPAPGPSFGRRADRRDEPDAEPDPWGTDPAAMPPVDPTAPDDPA